MHYKKKYLILGLILICIGCTTFANETDIARPYLNSLRKNQEGGFCIDKEDSALLLEYIKKLEYYYTKLK